jgi:thiamine biosynthesis lipoprotein
LIAARGTNVAGADDSLQRFEYTRIRMGVPVEITLYARSQEAANSASDAAYARIKALDRIMSDYDPDSELMRLCATAGTGQRVVVSPELACVLCRSQDLSLRTDGAFDVTVGPLVELWRIARRQKQLPSPERLQSAREKVGWRNLRLDQSARSVELLRTGMKLDLGGIAQGYAADEALRVLCEHGVRRALIDVSGDIVVGDPPPGRDAWRVEIEPLQKNDPHAKSQVLLLRNAAVTTAGDAYQFVEIDGVRYSHIVDPQTGLGQTIRRSVTVIAHDGVTADGLDTGVCLLEPDRGLRLVADTPGAEVSIVQAAGDGIETFASPGFARFLGPAFESP